MTAMERSTLDRDRSVWPTIVAGVAVLVGAAILVGLALVADLLALPSVVMVVMALTLAGIGTGIARIVGRIRASRASSVEGRVTRAAVAAAAAVTALGLMAIVGSQTGTSGSLQAIDDRFVDLMDVFGSTSPEQRISAFLTASATNLALFSAIAATSVALLLFRRRWTALTVALIVAGSQISVDLLKQVADRPRPPAGQAIYTSPSWPSGHAAGGLALALALTFVAWRSLHRGRWAVSSLILVFGLMVGYSRAVYTVHWLTDVASGWLLAIGFAFLVVAAFTFGDRLERLQPREGLIAIGSAVVVSVVFGLVNMGGVAPEPGFPQPAVQTISDIGQAVQSVDPYSTTLFGRSMEPVGVILVSDQATIESAVQQAGWAIADLPTIDNLARIYWSGITTRADPTAPVTPSFFDDRMQDLAIERPIDPAKPSDARRHHARLWELPFETENGCRLWVATASEDIGVEWNWHTILPNHKIAPDIDAERETVVNDLVGTGWFAVTDTISLVPSTQGTNAAGDAFTTDGRATIISAVTCA